jgi:hypothetical protein
MDRVEARSNGLLARLAPLVKYGALVVAFAFCARALLSADWRAAIDLARGAGPRVAVVLFPFAIAITLDALACKVLLGALGHRPAVADIATVRATSEAIAMSVPGGGVWAESLQPMLYASRCDVPATDGVAAMGVRKSVQTAAHGAYIATSVLLGYAILRDRSGAILGVDGLPWIVLASALVPLAISFTMAMTLGQATAVARLHALLARVPIGAVRAWAAAKKASFARTDSGFAAFATRAGQTRVRAAFALLYAAWLVESFEAYVILHALGVDIDFARVIAFEAGLSLVRSAAFFAPAGIGVQDAGYLAFIGDIASPGAGAAFVLVKRAKEIVWIAIGYALLLRARRAARARTATSRASAAIGTT